MKIFVTGASGMLGTTLYDVFTGAGHRVISTDLNPIDSWTVKLDVRDKEDVAHLIREASPDFVFNLAALTDLEYCETHPDETYATNTVGVENVAIVCKELGIPLVHISTAGVFDGTKNSPYTEEDTPNPVNIYGKSKYEAEKLVPKILDNYFIFRAGWMVGSGERDKKFVKKVLDLIDRGNKTIYGLTDMYGCPTYTLDFSKGLLKMITTSRDYGLYHMVNEGSSSRYDVAKRLTEVLGLDSVDVVPVTGDFFKKTFFAPRPPFEVIENKRLHDAGLKIMRRWDEAATDYLNAHFLRKYGRMRKRNVYGRPEKDINVYEGPLVSIVTTAYENEKFNKKYFDSVNNQTYKNIEVIFVDNLSPDNTVEDAKRRLKNGKVVASKVNTGCAGGNNIGVLEASGKYVFLLGPDAWVDEGCVEELVKAAEKGENIVYAPRQMTYDGSEFISCGIAADLFGYPARTYTADGKKQIRRVFYADGTGVFLNREDYLKIGMMDKESFLFAEDVDLSWKAHLLGMDVVPVPSAIVYHWSGGAVGTSGYPKGGRYETKCHRRFLAERNIIRNILKNWKWWNVLWILPFYLLINVFEMAALAITGQFGAIPKTYLKAYLWNIKNRKSTLNRRKVIQHARTVSDITVMKKMYFLPHKFLALLDVGIPKIHQ